MNLIEAQRELRFAIDAGNAVLMESPSGIGKSSINLQTFNELKERDAAKGITWGLGVIFAATQTPPDLIGFQFKGEREYGDGRKVTVTDPSVPLWMLSVPNGDDPGGKPAWMYDRFYLIIDEYGQGEPDVKRAMAEIFLNGGTAPWYLPPGSVRVACTNKGSRYGVTKDFDFCIARRTMIKIDGDVDVLLNFMDKPYVYQGRQWVTMPVTKAWAKTNPTIVFEPEPKEQGPFCNPRQLCAVDRYLQVRAEYNGGELPLDNKELPLITHHIAGTIGMPAATSIVEHLQHRIQLPAYEAVVADPEGTEVPTKADLMLLMVYEMAHKTQPDDLAAVIRYVSRMAKKAKDVEVTYITSLLRRDYKTLINHPAMQGWISKNAALVSIIASLSSN